MALLAGGLVGLALTGESKGLAVLAVLLYLVFFGLKLYGQTLFPASLFGELEANEKLANAESELVRRTRVFGYLDNSIRELNKQTCSVSFTDKPSVCNESVEIGLKHLLAPLIEQPQYVLSCDSSNFSVAARLEHYSEKDGELHIEERIVFLRDDLKLTPVLSKGDRPSTYDKDAFNDLHATGLRLAIRNVMHQAYNANTYCAASVTDVDRNLSLISSPIPMVCDLGDADGVLIIATDTPVVCPNDLPEVLQIYARLVANWISRHNECMAKKLGYDDFAYPPQDEQQHQPAAEASEQLTESSEDAAATE